MSTPLTLRKATRQKTKIRIGLSGPSGSGKTYSALLLASGMTSWDKIALIDTENGSGDLYSHLGDYFVLPLQAPFAPERYIEAIRECENAGIEVIVLDSATHEWDGKGGCLESNELLGQTKFKGNNWAAWSVTTPRHQRFLQAIVSSTCHIITTVRSKTDTIQTEDKKIKKVGLKEIQREGFEYELTLNFTLDRDGNYATASKDRTGMFINADPFKITAETGKKIIGWANEGIEPLPMPEPEVEEKPEKKKPTMNSLVGLLEKQGKPGALNTIYLQAFTYEWTPEESATISEAFVTAYARIEKLRRDGDKLFDDGGLLMSTVQRDASGKVIIVPNIPGQEVAEADRKEAEDAAKVLRSAATAE